MNRTLDRLTEFDEKSRGFAIRDRIGTVERKPRAWRLLVLTVLVVAAILFMVVRFWR